MNRRGFLSASVAIGLAALAPRARAAVTFPLSVHASGRYLVDAAGQPFFWHGDTPWSLAAQLDTGEIDTYLNDRAARGFNVILFNAVEHRFTSQSPAYLNANGVAPFSPAGNFGTRNEAYWTVVDYIVDSCHSLGIACLINPAYLGFGGGSEGWMSEVTAESAGDLQNYGAFLANRFDQGNVIWCFGGDYAGTTTERNKQWNIVTGIRSVRTTDLITGHADPGNGAYPSWSGFTGFNLNTAYPGSDDVYADCATEYARSGPIPFVMLEAIYEQERSPVISLAGLRRQAYTAILSGACGHQFGNNPIWHFQCTSPLYGYSGTWQSNLNSVGSQAMAYVKQLFTAFNWHLLEPRTNTSLVTTSLGSGDNRICPAIASNGSFAMIWTNGSNFTVNMSALSPSSVRARWYNTSNGTYSDVSGTPFSNTGTRAFTAPGERVLVLDSGALPAAPTNFRRTAKWLEEIVGTLVWSDARLMEIH